MRDPKKVKITNFAKGIRAIPAGMLINSLTPGAILPKNTA